jgi:hypothetical protein
MVSMLGPLASYRQDWSGSLGPVFGGAVKVLVVGLGLGLGFGFFCKDSVCGTRVLGGLLGRSFDLENELSIFLTRSLERGLFFSMMLSSMSMESKRIV